MDTNTEHIQGQCKETTVEANRRFIEPTKNRSKAKTPRRSSVIPQGQGRGSRSENPTLPVIRTQSRGFGKQPNGHPYTDTKLAPAASMSPAKMELARKMALFRVTPAARSPETSEKTSEKRMRSRSTTPETEQRPMSERLPRRASVEFARTKREPGTPAAPSSSSSSCSTIPGNSYHNGGALFAMRNNPPAQSNRKIGGAAARRSASAPFIDDDDSDSTSSNDPDQREDQREDRLENQRKEAILARGGEEGEGEGEIPRPNSEPSGENGWDVIGRPPFDNLTEEDEEKAAMEMETKIKDAWKERAADVDLSEFPSSYRDHVIGLIARGTPPAFVTMPAARFLVRQLGVASLKHSYPCRHPAWGKAYSALNLRDRRGMRHWIQNAKQGESQLYDEGVKLNDGRHCPVPRFPKAAKTDRQTLWELSLLAILCRALKPAKPTGQKKSRVHKQSLGKTMWLENDPIIGLGRVRPSDRDYGILQSSPEWVRFLNHIPEGKPGEPPRPPQGAATPSAPSPDIKSSPQPSEASHRPRRAAPKSYALEAWSQTWGAEAAGEDDDDWSPEPKPRLPVCLRQQPRGTGRSVEAQRSSLTLTTGAGDAGSSARDAPWPLPSTREPYGAGRSRTPGNLSPVVHDSASDGGVPSNEMTPQPSQPTPPATDSGSYCLAAGDLTPTSNTVEDREGSGADAAPQPRAVLTRPHTGEKGKRPDGGARPPSTCGALGQVQKAVEKAQKHSKEAMSGAGKMASAGAREDWAKLENAVGNLEDPMESTHAALEEAIGVAKDAQQACGGDTDAARTARKAMSRLAAARTRSEEARDAQSEAARVVWRRRPEATRPATVRLIELVESVDEALREAINVLAARPKRKADDDGGAETKRLRQ